MSSSTKQKTKIELDKKTKPTQQGDEPMIWDDLDFDFDRVMGPEDLKPRRGMNINPPPSDVRCQCCGRHTSELTPFGGPANPVFGDFSRKLLVKNWRPDAPYDEEAVRARDEAEDCFEIDGYTDSREWLWDKSGQAEGERLYWVGQLCCTYGSSWE